MDLVSLRIFSMSTMSITHSAESRRKFYINVQEVTKPYLSKCTCICGHKNFNDYMGSKRMSVYRVKKLISPTKPNVVN